MNKLTVMKGNKKYEILIDDYKMIYGSNYEEKFDILRTLLIISNNVKPSEYAEQEDNIPKIYVNDKVIKSKDIMIYHVTKYYSLTNDFKLNTKSLIYQYLEILLDSSEYIDTINSINILFESLSLEISSHSSISGQFNNMFSKQLIKLITPFYMDNEYSKNEYDFSIEELILLQLNIIKYITESNKTIQYYIICLDIPEMTKQIYHTIKSMRNCYILIFVERDNNYIDDVCRYYICERKSFDIANDNELYELICDNNLMLLTLKEGREYMEKYLFQKEHEYAEFISKILIK